MSRRFLRGGLLVALLMGALASASCEDNAPGERVVFVIDELRILITPEDRDGTLVIDGFDIDDSNGPPEGATCRSQNQDDFVAPDGREGIDNSFASGGLANLVGILSQQPGDDASIFEGLVQSAVTGGTLLVLLEIEGLNNLENDRDVTLTIHLGEPFDVGVGTDGRLLAGQSFDLREEVPPVRVDAEVRDGVLYANGINMQLTGSILDVTFELPVELGRLALTFNPNGTVTGILGGGLPWRTIADVVPRIGGAEQFASIASRILSGLADVMNEETGECDKLSAAIRVHGVPAFIFEDEGI